MKVFIDTEFDKLTQSLLSMALVADNGNALYLVMTEVEKRLFRDAELMPDPTKLEKRIMAPRTLERFENLAWLKDNVLPHLYNVPTSVPVVYCDTKHEAWEHLERFLGTEPAHLVSDWPSDFAFFCNLVTDNDGKRAQLGQLSMEVKFVDAYPTKVPGAIQHNAYWDALALRERLREIEAV